MRAHGRGGLSFEEARRGDVGASNAPLSTATMTRQRRRSGRRARGADAARQAAAVSAQQTARGGVRQRHVETIFSSESEL